MAVFKSLQSIEVRTPYTTRKLLREDSMLKEREPSFLLDRSYQQVIVLLVYV